MQADLKLLLDKALGASAEGEKDEAIAIYQNILAQKEDWSTPHYNLGLIYKYRCDWERSYYHNKRAVTLRPEDKDYHWNMGIAATMLKDWKLARQCWNVFGMTYEIIDQDTAGNIGRAPIRINPGTKGEVVWSTRLCPARAEINNIPYPESEHRYKDIVLNDGAANGYRLLGGKEYPVFDEIQHLVKSVYQTFTIKCKLPDLKLFTMLCERCEQADIETENWTTSVRILCRKCSEGKPHEHHDHDLEKTSDEYLLAFASTSTKKLKAVLDAWSSESGVDYYEPHFYD
jgi:hypothetical protein